MMGFLLGLVLGIAWLAGGLALIVLPIAAIVRIDFYDTTDRLVSIGFAVVLVVVGIIALLGLGAVVTGDVSFNSVADGCYHVYSAGSGKTRHTEYDPIPCPWTQP